jgi:hypothetical protein
MSKTIGPLLIAVAGMALLPLLQAGATGARVHYVGGTGAGLIDKSEVTIELTADDDLVLTSKGASLHIPYSSVNTVEYGQKVERRVAEAILISPILLLAKRREHFLTIGFVDVTGHQQAMVFRVGSGDVRSLLVGLEARTGRKVEYQDDEARRAGKG